MAIKIIKFDLPINGTKVTTLEALRDNLTDEIVPLARSGQLERWFKSRQMQAQAQAVAAAVSQHAGDTALFLALCAVLEVEVHPADASAIFDAPPKAGQHFKGGKYFELYQELQVEHETLREFARNRILKMESVIKKMLVDTQNPAANWQDRLNANFEISPVEFKDKQFRLELEEILKNSIEI